MLSPVLPTRWVIFPADSVDDADVFPFLAGQTFLAEKTPTWSTKIDTAVDGTERRRALWSYPIWLFQFGYGVLRSDVAFLELQRLVTFFNSKFGSTQAFFYLDRTDYAVTNMAFGTGNGTLQTFQLTRTTTIGGITFTEPVRAFNGTPRLFINGVETTAFTVGALGQITFTVAPANGTALTWTGQFFFLCRFEKDTLDGLKQEVSNLWSLNALNFRSLKA